MANTTVKKHKRLSPNGKLHTVKQHSRNFEMGAMLKKAAGKPTPKKIAQSTAFAASFTALAWIISTSTSVIIAAVWAVILVCLGILTYIFMTTQDRRRTRKELRHTAATSMKRKLRLWTHHRMVNFQKEAPRREAKPAPKVAKPKPAPKPKPETPKATPRLRKATPHLRMADNRTWSQMKTCTSCKGEGSKLVAATHPTKGVEAYLSDNSISTTHKFIACSTCKGQGKV